MSRNFITPIADEGMYVLDTGSWRNFRPVMDKKKCHDCGICFTFCPVNAISRADGRFEINLTYCKGCAICARECPRDAINMITEGDK
ncbi:MAG: 4Fe-4S binding protein [Dehalobacterium sp.]